MKVIECNHCNISFQENVLIKDEDKFFCCKGCQGVYHLLKDDGLDSFYDKKGKNTLSKPLAINEDTSNFDLNSFHETYVKITDDGFNKINLIIEGIHCSACIWLNEKILNDENGILEASINFTSNKATILWHDESIKLSQIIKKIRSIGYNAYPYNIGHKEEDNLANKREYFSKLSVAIVASMNIMVIDVAKYSGYLTSMDSDILGMIHLAEFVFATPVLFYSGWVFFKGAYFALKNKIINMDFLVAFGSTLTYIYSLYVLISGVGNSYFDSVAMIITFVLVGKYLEVIGKKNANDTIDKIKSSIPHEATIIKNDKKHVVSVNEIIIDDIIEVKNGEKASVDGLLMSYYASFDQSSISGESINVSKNIGDTIYSGTINTSDVIRYKATKTYSNSTFNTIIEALEDSLNSRPKIQDFTNEISKNFSFTIFLISILSFITWYFFTNDFEKSLIIGISVIVIACPCALALATPIASLVGVSWLSSKGLLFKEAKLIEAFTNMDTVVFDKTGTLTSAKLDIKNIDNIDLNESNINILYSLVGSTNHLVSVAIKEYLEKNYKKLSYLDLKEIKQIPAIGINAFYENKKLYGGKNENSIYTSFIFKIDDKIIISFDLEDSLREDAKETIQYLKNKNLDVIICSGDNENVIKNIAKQLNINKYKANMTPIQKSKFIEELQIENKKVVFVGDGVNDVLALSKADISVSLSSGSDISIDISDVVILNNKLDGVKQSFYISNRTYKFIKQNLFISFVYNIITIPIAIAGYVVPLIAALSMSISSLLVVLNSMRIKTK